MHPCAVNPSPLCGPWGHACTRAFGPEAAQQHLLRSVAQLQDSFSARCNVLNALAGWVVAFASNVWTCQQRNPRLDSLRCVRWLSLSPALRSCVNDEIEMR